MASDLLVVGAGPAGLATAIFAAQEGLGVVVLAGARSPQHKACGEGLMPAGIACLDRMQVQVPTAERQPLLGVAYQSCAGAMRAEASFAAEAQGWGLRRCVLDACLQARAQQLGVQVVTARLLGCAQQARSVRAHTTAGEFVSAHLVGADGLHSRVRRLAGLQAAYGGRKRFGLRRHLQQAPWSACIEVYLGAGAEAYVTPVGPQQINVAFLTSSPKDSWSVHLARFPALAQRLHGAALAAAAPALGAGPFGQNALALATGRVALVGDAAGYVDAVTGEGVSLAMLSAEAFVAALATQAPAAAYAEAVRGLRRHYAWHARLLLWLVGQGWLHRPALRLLRACPRLFAAWVGRAGALPRPRVA